ncbi:MAG: endonuclease [Planctomycetota bacterium]
MRPRLFRELLAIPAVAFLVAGHASSPSPSKAPSCEESRNYYASVQAGTPAELRLSLHELIDDHTRVPYTSSATDTWDVLEAADQDPTDSGNVIDLYKNASYAKAGGGNSNYNREHSWPKSYGFPHDGASNYPYTDCHHLFLCNSRYNSSRSNKPYGTCDANATEKVTETNLGRGGQGGGYPGDSNWTQSGAWETWVGRRGDVARALFYLDVRYEGGQHLTGSDEPDLILTNNLAFIQASQTGNNEDVAYMGMLSVLLKWHCEDPVDNLERQRNDAIFAAQGNRNPFIDHPEWVHTLWGAQCPSAPVHLPAPPVAGAVWVSEIHYDNAGADTGEFIEVAGPVGTDLSGWSLVLYNGRDSQIYRTKTLSGTITGSVPNGASAFDIVGIQNGPKDGVALVDPDGTLIELLSYEGTFTGAEGIATGVTSTDIGVSEPGSTPVGQSLQRPTAGAGWIGPAPHTRGSL